MRLRLGGFVQVVVFIVLKSTPFAAGFAQILLIYDRD
jgi:hypothetical protein